MRLDEGFRLFNFSKVFLVLNNCKRFYFVLECDGLLQCFVTLGLSR